MATNLQALSDADFRAVFNRRTSLANWFGLVAAALFAPPFSLARAGCSPTFERRPERCSCCSASWAWLRPVGVEARRRSLKV